MDLFNFLIKEQHANNNKKTMVSSWQQESSEEIHWSSFGVLGRDVLIHQLLLALFKTIGYNFRPGKRVFSGSINEIQLSECSQLLISSLGEVLLPIQTVWQQTSRQSKIHTAPGRGLCEQTHKI